MMGIFRSPFVDVSHALINTILSTCETGDLIFMRRFGYEVYFADSFVAAVDGIAHVAIIMPEQMVSDATYPTGHRLTPLKSYLEKFNFEYLMIFRPALIVHPDCLATHTEDLFTYTAVRSEEKRNKTSHSCTSWSRSLLRQCRSAPFDRPYLYLHDPRRRTLLEKYIQKTFLDNWKDGIMPQTILQEEEGRVLFEMGCRTCNLPHRILLFIISLTIVAIFTAP